MEAQLAVVRKQMADFLTLVFVTDVLSHIWTQFEPSLSSVSDVESKVARIKAKPQSSVPEVIKLSLILFGDLKLCMSISPPIFASLSMSSDHWEGYRLSSLQKKVNDLLFIRCSHLCSSQVP